MNASLQFAAFCRLHHFQINQFVPIIVIMHRYYHLLVWLMVHRTFTNLIGRTSIEVIVIENKLSHELFCNMLSFSTTNNCIVCHFNNGWWIPLCNLQTFRSLLHFQINRDWHIRHHDVCYLEWGLINMNGSPIYN
jgi:hypothetical protein